MCPETQENEQKKTSDGISASIPAREETANQSNTAGDSGSMCPETPENERRNKFSEIATQRNPTKKVCKTTSTLPTADKKTARKPSHGTSKSAPQAMVTGHSKTPGAEGRRSQHLISNVTFLEKRIGEGAFGFVEKVKVDGKICAGKHFKDDRNYNEKTFRKEFKIVQELKHDHIVYYYGYHILPRCSQRNKSPVLIMECLEINLHDFLLRDLHHDLPLARKVDLLCGIAQGLNYLHSNNIIHRDLTATNVLLDSRAVPKISDFGNSCVTGTDLGSQLHSQSYRCYGTLNYMAPEAQSRTYGAEIDIFSFGHLSLFVGIQKSPKNLLPPNYSEADDDDDDDSVRGRTEVERRQEYFTLLYERIEEKHPLVLLMKTCLRINPKRRPKAHELVQKLDAMCRELPPPPPLTIGIQKQRK